MTGRIHHVCYCVEPEQVDAVKDFWVTALGAEFLDLDLEPLGIRALIAWEAGIEVIAPTYPTGRVAQATRAFLDTRGPGVYTVVFDVDDLRPALCAAAERGAEEVFRETLPVMGALADRYTALENVTLSEVHGMRVALQQLVAADGVPLADGPEGSR